MKKWFLSILSEKDGKGSAKRVAGFFSFLLFVQIIQIITYVSVIKKEELPNQSLFLKILEYNFILIAAALVGITVGMLKKPSLPFYNRDHDLEDEYPDNRTR